jgi:hypothetical protein
MRRYTMKTVIGVAIALALALSVVPAMAEDTFQAFSNMPAGEQELLTPLSDAQLAAVEGGLEIEIVDVCTICTNIADVAQANVNTSAFSKVRQKNVAVVKQEIN